MGQVHSVTQGHSATLTPHYIIFIITYNNDDSDERAKHNRNLEHVRPNDRLHSSLRKKGDKNHIKHLGVGDGFGVAQLCPYITHPNINTRNTLL